MYIVSNDELKFQGAQFLTEDVAQQQPSFPFWVVFEGDNGAGKSTTAHILKIVFAQMGRPVVVEAEGKFIDPQVGETEHYWGERAVRHRWLVGFLKQGASVIQDRSWLSTLMYQHQDLSSSLALANVMYGALGEAPDAVFLFEGKNGYGLYAPLLKYTAIIVPSVSKIIPIIGVPYEASPEKRAFWVLNHLTGTFSDREQSKWGDGGSEAES